MLKINQKRIFDVTVTLLTAVIWVPVLSLCAAAIAVFEGRPIFYVSKRRVGASVKPVIKFRTMVRNAESIYNRDTVPVSGNVRFLNTPPDSPLYTRTGRVIERFALTEIPQLVMVLKGDMSLVGNRPLPVNVIDSLKKAIPDVNERPQARAGDLCETCKFHDYCEMYNTCGASDLCNVEGRFITLAGMTGPVQLVGRTELSDGDRLTLETMYSRIASGANSWRLDFIILLCTVLIVLRIRQPLKLAEVQRLMMRYARARGPDIKPA
jgi:lipopolysaccharide/colanic/teichoic acid biosynthesis glycosyltransferase